MTNICTGKCLCQLNFFSSVFSVEDNNFSCRTQTINEITLVKIKINVGNFSSITLFTDFLIYPLSLQGRSQNLKQVSQIFTKAFNVDDGTLTFQLMTLNRKINIASEKIINYRVTSQSNNCCQISIIVWERLGISVMIHFFLFLRCYRKIFKFFKPVLCVYFNITISIWQKVNEAFQHLPV